MFSLTELRTNRVQLQTFILYDGMCNFCCVNGIVVPCDLSTLLLIRFAGGAFDYDIKSVKNGGRIDYIITFSTALCEHLGCAIGDNLAWTVKHGILNLEKLFSLTK